MTETCRACRTPMEVSESHLRCPRCGHDVGMDIVEDIHEEGELVGWNTGAVSGLSVVNARGLNSLHAGDYVALSTDPTRPIGIVMAEPDPARPWDVVVMLNPPGS